MLENLIAAQPLFGVLLYQIIDKRYGRLGDVLRVFYLGVLHLNSIIAYIQDLLHCFFAADVIERGLPHQQLISQHSQAP